MATELYCIRISIRDTRRALVTDCYADVGNRHVFGTANGGADGGISTWIGNVGGACRALGGATTYVGHAGRDGEFYFDKNSTIGYRLIEPNAGKIGSYTSHGGSPLVMNRLAILRSHVTLPGKSDYLPRFRDLPGDSGADDVSNARGFIIDDWYDGGDINHAGVQAPFVNGPTTRINCYTRLASIGAFSSRTSFYEDVWDPAELNEGFLFNCTFDLDFSKMSRNSAFGILKHRYPTGSPAVLAEHCLFNVTMPAVPKPLHAFVGFSTYASDHANFSGGGWKLVNCIVQTDVEFPLGGYVDVPSSAPGTGGYWGGQLSTAAANMTGADGDVEGPRFGYASAPGAVTLAIPVGIEDVFAPQEAWAAGAAAGLEYDRYGRSRDTSSPAIGPNIAGLECAGDVTTQGAAEGHPAYGVPDGQATAADIQYYVNGWIDGDLAADVTTQGAGAGDPGYGVPDGLVSAADIQFFVNSWLTGCD